MRTLGWLLAAAALLVLGAGGWFAAGWYGSSGLEKDTAFIVPQGSSLTAVAQKLEDEGIVGSSEAFLLRARILGSGDAIQAGEFALPAGASPATRTGGGHQSVARRAARPPQHPGDPR